MYIEYAAYSLTLYLCLSVSLSLYHSVSVYFFKSKKKFSGESLVSEPSDQMAKTEYAAAEEPAWPTQVRKPADKETFWKEFFLV